MGCGASTQVVRVQEAPPTKRLKAFRHKALKGILIQKAEDLRDTDFVGTSDPYVIVRLGVAGSTWADKSGETERRSHTVSGTTSPSFQFAFSFSPPPEGKDWELHARVYDDDLLTSDDFLGECVVSLAELNSHADELRSYSLGAGSKAGGCGSLVMMTGDRVEAALLAEVSEAIVEYEGMGTMATLMSPLGRVASKLGQWFENSTDGVTYAFNMARLALGWSKPPAAFDDPASAFIAARVDAKGVWSGPFGVDCVSLTSHVDVVASLRTFGERLGTTDGNGEVVRDNFLGYQQLGSTMWPEVPWHGIGLSAPTEVHAWARPILVRLCGPSATTHLGGDDWLEERARAFFLGRRTLRVGKDLSIFAALVQHEVMLGIKLSEAEAEAFGSMQGRYLLAMAVPDSAVDVVDGVGLIDFHKLLDEKAAWLVRYRDALRTRLRAEEVAALGEVKIGILASLVADALLLAGGVSVPTTISFALALPYSEWGTRELPKGFTLDDTSLTMRYVLEILRKFSPVVGIPYAERSAGNTPPRRVFLNLMMASRDKSVWGDDADVFRLRPVVRANPSLLPPPSRITDMPRVHAARQSDYHKYGVNFADAAVSPLLSSANSHSCPGKDFGLQTICAFLRAFARTAAPYGGVKKLWQARHLAAKGAKKPETSPLPPEELTVNYFTTAKFQLDQIEGVLSLPSEALRSNEALLEGLDEDERAELNMEAQSYSDNKLWQTNVNTQAFIRIVPLAVKPGAVGTSLSVRAVFPPPNPLDDRVQSPIGGITFIKSDEDRVSKVFKTLSRLIIMRATAALPLKMTEHEEVLTYWGADGADGTASSEESVAEACMHIDAVLGEYLPAQYQTWDDLDTDDGMAALCVYGVGAWYLQAARPSDVCGHPTPPDAALECSLEYMAKYPTRAPWMRYGGVVYLGPAGSALPPLLGIWSCHHEKLVAPGDAMWPSTKASFKSSLGTSLTLKDHLGYLHWVIANGLQAAARTTLGSDHPLRRLLKQFYFGTAAINVASADMLMPVNGFGFRTFGFTAEAWVDYFDEMMAEWVWRPFPERIQRTGLPAAFLETWPLAVDGLAVWHTLEGYVRDLVGLFYHSDDDVRGDAEIVDFWASFESQFDTPWRLPPLAVDSLVMLLTDLIFSVTATHELVGSIVEYLTSVHGLASKLIDGTVEPDVQSHAQALVIIALTGMRQPPLLDEWTHLFHCDQWTTAQQQAVLDRVRRLQVELMALGRDNDDRNAERESRVGRRFVAFNPRIFETSVSI